MLYRHNIHMYLEFRLSSRSVVFFYLLYYWASRSQSQALNSNLLRGKLKLQWQYEQQNQNLLQKVELESTLRNMLP